MPAAPSMSAPVLPMIAAQYERDVDGMSRAELVPGRPTLVGDETVAPEAPATLSRRARNARLTVHIAASVALLGDVLALTAVTLKAMGADDPETARTSYEIMSMSSLAFGFPLSMGALLSGLALGWGTRWGVLRYPWVIVKLGPIAAVILAGALVIGPAEGWLLDDPVSDATRTPADVIILAAGCSTWLGCRPPSRSPCSSRAVAECDRRGPYPPPRHRHHDEQLHVFPHRHPGCCCWRLSRTAAIVGWWRVPRRTAASMRRPSVPSMVMSATPGGAVSVPRRGRTARPCP